MITQAPTRRKRTQTLRNGVTPELAVAPALIKLDIACGQNKQEGYTGIDIAPCDGVDIVHDLWTYPWPIEDDSVEQAFCSHYVEHIPMEYIKFIDGRPYDGTLVHGAPNQITRKDALLAFFDEVYRILVPDGTITIIGPYANSDRAWQDPTHRRAINANTFLYTWKAWREGNKLDHYNVTCDFDFSYGYGFDPTWASRNDEARAYALKHYWNVANDIYVTLIKRVGR